MLMSDEEMIEKIFANLKELPISVRLRYLRYGGEDCSYILFGASTIPYNRFHMLMKTRGFLFNKIIKPRLRDIGLEITNNHIHIAGRDLS